MRQILINLIGNAVKFTEVGQVLLLIENDPEASGPGVLRFTVADSGIGIAPEKINSIFSSFTQADSSTTRKYGGSGLGLSIAQRLAGLMDGHIRVESQLHKGSKFSFSVPFELGHAPDSPRALPNLAGYRVLIVEVSAITRLILRETIARLGGAVSEAACHEEAIAIVREADRSGEPIRMVLFASRMSGGDGFELARQIRRESSSAPLFIPTLSPDDSKSQVVVLRGEGMDAYVVNL